jgi:hypothetical protein
MFKAKLPVKSDSRTYPRRGVRQQIAFDPNPQKLRNCEVI